VSRSTNHHNVDLLGIRVAVLRMNELLRICEEHITAKSSLLLSVVNVAKLVNCRKDGELRKSVMDADIVLADGLPIVWLSKLIGDPLPERLAGIDIMYGLLERASRKNYSVYFLGAQESIVQKVVQTVNQQYPGLCIAGYRDGYFAESDSKEVAQEIRNSSADILLVAISSPKKENFLRDWRKFMNVPVCHGVGGSFDILAGATKRAPFWVQRYGFEWLYRLIQEPRRMWKRYLVTNAIFMKLSLEAILRAKLRLSRATPDTTACNCRDTKHPKPSG